MDRDLCGKEKLKNVFSSHQKKKKKDVFNIGQKKKKRLKLVTSEEEEVHETRSTTL